MHPCHDSIAIITVSINRVWYVQLHISRSVATLLRPVIQQMLNRSVCQGQKRSRPSNEYVAICFGERNFDIAAERILGFRSSAPLIQLAISEVVDSTQSARGQLCEQHGRGRTNSLEADGVTCARGDSLA